MSIQIAGKSPVSCLFLLALFAVSAAGPDVFAMGMSATSPLETVPYVDLTQYVGRWYEIARLPQTFEKGCTGVTADYASRSDGRIDVLNTCRKERLDGPVKTAKGIARVVDRNTQAKLKVSFFWPFEGDYWVLELGPDYSYSVVGSPDRKSLWILSRTPQMSEDLIQEILGRRAAQGFDLSALERTLQP